MRAGSKRVARRAGRWVMAVVMVGSWAALPLMPIAAALMSWVGHNG